MTFVTAGVTGGGGGVAGATNALAQPHDLTHSPVGLWQLDEVLTDSSGNGRTLVVKTGVERYTAIAPGLVGFGSEGGDTVGRSSHDAALALAGDMTVEFIARLERLTGNDYIVSFAGSGESSAVNSQYSIATPSSLPSHFYFLSESGSGVDAVYEPEDLWPIGTPFHFALTRASDVISFYINGVQAGASSGTLTTPTGGGSGTFNIGSFEGISSFIFGGVASVKLIASALTAVQVKDEYNRTLGPVYGIQDSVVTPTTLTADADDYNPTRFGTAETFRVSADAPRTITGFESGNIATAKRTIINVGVQPIDLSHNDPASVAANRLLVPGGAAVTMLPDASVTLQFDAVASKWRIT